MKMNWLLFVCMMAIGCESNTSNSPQSGHTPTISEKMNGVSFVGAPKAVKSEAFNHVQRIHANWITLMPFGFTNDGDPNMKYNIDWQWWGEREEGIIKCSEYAKERGIKVMIKPQLWIQHGSFTGDFKLDSDAKWKIFEEGYENFILDYAYIADSVNADAYCIGTELKEFFNARPEFWGQLIDKVREIYDGPLTYAGNWDSYHKFPHWSKLDYIGIDAYFPLSDRQTPTVKELKKGWESHFRAIKSHQESVGKPVIFTEYGYRSINKNANTPWDSGLGGEVNLNAQDNAYRALFEMFWEEDWFAGGFLWKWFDFHESAGGKKNNRFTPQNKPAETTIRNWYKQH